MKNLIGLVLFILSFPLPGQHAHLEQTIDSLIIAQQSRYDIPGLSIAVVHYNVIIYNKGFGVKNINTKQPIDHNTLFHTASLSKLFTAQAVMDLVDKKYFMLDDKISTLLPEFIMDDQRYKDITVHQLLNHTSGMPDVVNYHWSDERENPEALKNYVLSMADKKLTSTPGKSFEYSSMGYDLLGYLIEKVTRESFANYMKQKMLESFGMINSNFDYFNIPPAQRTSPHSKSFLFKNRYTRKVYPYNPAHAPSSTLNASSYELALWMKALLNSLKTNTDRENLTSSTLRLMLTPSENYDFIGLGWFIGTLESKKSYYHFGGDKGFRSYLILLPEQNLGLVLLANCDYDEDFRQNILHEIARVVLKK